MYPFKCVPSLRGKLGDPPAEADFATPRLHTPRTLKPRWGPGGGGPRPPADMDFVSNPNVFSCRSVANFTTSQTTMAWPSPHGVRRGQLRHFPPMDAEAFDGFDAVDARLGMAKPVGVGWPTRMRFRSAVVKAEWGQLEALSPTPRGYATRSVVGRQAR